VFYLTYIPFILGFALLLSINLRVTKSTLSPPVLFAGVWLISLIALFLSGDTFFDISLKTLSVYLIGALFFSIGAILGQSSEGPRALPALVPIRQRNLQQSYHYLFLDAILLLLLAGLPFYWRYIQEQFGVSGGQLILAQIRMQAVQLSGKAQSFNLINNFPVIATFVAAVLYYDNDGTAPKRWRFYLAFILAAVYGSMEGSKKPIAVLMLTIFFIASIRERRIHVFKALTVLCIGVVVFSAGLTVVNFAYMRTPLNMDTLGTTLAVDEGYWLGSLVAFNQIVADRAAIESTQRVDRFFLETANSLGANYYVPSLHAAYTDISTAQNTNTYTIYFTYYKDYGWLGTAAFMFFIGFVAGSIYNKAKHGDPVPVLIYAMVATTILFSIQSEGFLTGLNGYIKAFLFFIFIYKVLPLLRHRRRLAAKRIGYA
jgi:oligosaccharide repeat unit polymerase